MERIAIVTAARHVLHATQTTKSDARAPDEMRTGGLSQVKPVESAATAVRRVSAGASVAIGGSGAGHAIPDALLRALGERHRSTGSPTDLTLLHPFGVGDQQGKGLQQMAIPALYRRVIGGHWSMAPAMAQLAAENRFAAYCLPAGVMVQLFHCAAAGSPGWYSHAGLDTFVDPRLEGGRLNAKATETLVDYTEIAGKPWLFYKTIPVDVALVHAWEADEQGNLSMRHEAGLWHNCALAQAAKASGGTTIAIVRKIVPAGALDPRNVCVPGCFVDALVVDEEQGQTYQTEFEPSFCGEAHLPEDGFPPLPFGPRKVIARRAAAELVPGAVINVGFGIPDGVIAVAREQGIADQVTATIEHGQFGGVPAGGLDFGAVYNPDAILETGHMFDFYHGRGVDQTFLGFLQIDRAGNVNVSKIGSKIIGVGGFIDIVQKADKVVFCGTLAIRAKTSIDSGKLRFLAPGAPKIVDQVAQVTFSADYARRTGQEVLYVTEAAVFRMGEAGLLLEEIAPGVEVERDLLPQLGFHPQVHPNLKRMDPALFSPDTMPDAAFAAFDANEG